MRPSLAAAALLAMCAASTVGHAADDQHDHIKTTVDKIVQPVMAKDNIPGMAIGLVVGGTPYIFDYGVASVESRKPVTRDTLFEVGSVSKTFTATLAAYAQDSGYLSLSDKTSKYLTSLKGSPFGGASLLNLGTHTAGELPLQVPDNIRNEAQLMQYLKDWRSPHAPGTYRTYTNIGIGMLGLITAKSTGERFSALMEHRILPALGMSSTYIDVPRAKMPDYAEGYTKQGAPTRMAPGVLSSEAYGIRTTATDLTRFVEANMNLVKLDAKLQRAIEETHTGYFKAGVLTQDLIWEQYPYPVELKTLLEGNSSRVIVDTLPASRITPPQQPQESVWINKTGSTNGFGAYVAFVPEKQLGIVILANKNYPLSDRVTVAYEILTSLANVEE